MEKINILGFAITRPEQELIIMRGISGSGKSSIARKLVKGGSIHSTDELIEAEHDYDLFFQSMKESGQYYPLVLLHSQNLKNATDDMYKGISPVVIDNTNIFSSEIKVYVEAALKIGFDEKNIKFIEVGTGGKTAKVLSQRNSHGVPLDRIKEMIKDYKLSGTMTIEKVLG